MCLYSAMVNLLYLLSSGSVLKSVSNDFHHLGTSLPLKVYLSLRWDAAAVPRLLQGIGDPFVSQVTCSRRQHQDVYSPFVFPLILLYLCLLPVHVAYSCPAAPCYFGPLQGLGSSVGPHHTAILLPRLVAFLRQKGRVGRTHSCLCSLNFHPSLLPQ